ncbi:uncharacterized protein [Eleutherodactylus coqui]|uniref:Uncharacterized protein n=1 Tax=Eleutherodactylus coqui TaxID=57060 RepID=A0A8J6EK29_ELECQ|nr:hypothetical protein GDO78_017903 [Eleutherodactylus coqui]
MVTVGIISRCSIENYRWLLHFLYTFLPEVNVRTVTITNHSAMSISGISFAILYHSKTRGRLNVIDVTDSLYDSELKELSYTLGAENVIVVMDDLDDNSEQVKSKLLENQHSIGILARELFLFSIQEKQDGDINPTNVANKSKIKAMITGRAADSHISHIYSDYTESSCKMYPNRLVVSSFIIPVMLCLFLFALYWYNCRVLQC